MDRPDKKTAVKISGAVEGEMLTGCIPSVSQYLKSMGILLYTIKGKEGNSFRLEAMCGGNRKKRFECKDDLFGTGQLSLESYISKEFQIPASLSKIQQRIYDCPPEYFYNAAEFYKKKMLMPTTTTLDGVVQKILDCRALIVHRDLFPPVNLVACVDFIKNNSEGHTVFNERNWKAYSKPYGGNLVLTTTVIKQSTRGDKTLLNKKFKELLPKGEHPVQFFLYLFSSNLIRVGVREKFSCLADYNHFVLITALKYRRHIGHREVEGRLLLKTA